MVDSSSESSLFNSSDSDSDLGFLVHIVFKELISCSIVLILGNILSSSQTQDLENVFIEAKEIYLEVKGDCILHSTNIITKAIYVKTYNLFFTRKILV